MAFSVVREASLVFWVMCSARVRNWRVVHRSRQTLRCRLGEYGTYIGRLRKEHRRLQGIIHGKRSGTTENIGSAARKKVEVPGLSVSSSRQRS
jgi:hypothetical protein